MSNVGDDTTRNVRDTASADYTEHMLRLRGAWWKRLIDVQRPYRWNFSRDFTQEGPWMWGADLGAIS